MALSPKSSYRPETMAIVGAGAIAARFSSSNASPCSKRTRGRGPSFLRCLSLFDVRRSEVAQIRGHIRIAVALHRVEDVATAAGGNVEDAHCTPIGARAVDGRADQLLEIHLPLTDAAPTGTVEIRAVDEFPDAETAARFVLVDVIERATGIEPALPPEANAVAELPDRLERGRCTPNAIFFSADAGWVSPSCSRCVYP